VESYRSVHIVTTPSGLPYRTEVDRPLPNLLAYLLTEHSTPPQHPSEVESYQSGNTVETLFGLLLWTDVGAQLPKIVAYFDCSR
jgi:hypothetical protein